MKDGTVYKFQEASAAVRPMQAGLLSINDRYNNVITMTRAAGDLTRVTSPNGRWIEFTIDAAHRITGLLPSLLDRRGRDF